MNKLKIGDNVVVTSGKDKGKTGKIVKLFWNKNAVLVEGVNLATKTVKPSQENPSGGFVKKENAINISNISLCSPKTGKPTKVGIKELEGKKVRFAKACGTNL